LSLFIDPASITRLLDLFREVLEVTLATAFAQSPVAPEIKPAPQPIERPQSPQSTGLDLKASDQVKAADLRTALLLGNAATSRSCLATPNRTENAYDANWRVGAA
jgi:hypothetical protein